jgi:hypothetical protein
MTYGPYGANNLKSLYMIRKTPSSPLECLKKFLKPFYKITIIIEDRYPQYRRCNDRWTFIMPKLKVVNEVVVRDNT